MKTNTNIQEKRNYLKSLSKGLNVLVKEGTIDSINEGLSGIYAENGHSELKTIYQWNSEGKRVKKGETAFLLWGKPQKYTRNHSNQTRENKETKETDFYPLCYVFSNLQVEKANDKNNVCEISVTYKNKKFAEELEQVNSSVCSRDIFYPFFSEFVMEIFPFSSLSVYIIILYYCK
jgi:hypothetical protein